MEKIPLNLRETIKRTVKDHLEKENGAIIELIDLDTQENLITVLEKLCWAINCSREKL